MYLLVDVFGKAGHIEAAVVPGDMCLLFSRKCVEELDITPRLRHGRVYVGEEQLPTVVTTMMNGHAVLPVFPAKYEEEEWVANVEEARQSPIKRKKGDWLVYEVFACKGNITKILKKQGILVRSFGLADGDDLLSDKTRNNFFKLYDEEQPDAVFMSPE